MLSHYENDNFLCETTKQKLIINLRYAVTHNYGSVMMLSIVGHSNIKFNNKDYF